MHLPEWVHIFVCKANCYMAVLYECLPELLVWVTHFQISRKDLPQIWSSSLPVAVELVLGTSYFTFLITVNTTQHLIFCKYLANSPSTWSIMSNFFCICCQERKTTTSRTQRHTSTLNCLCYACAWVVISAWSQTIWLAGLCKHRLLVHKFYD